MPPVRDFPPRSGKSGDSQLDNHIDLLTNRQNIDLLNEVTTLASGDEFYVFDVSADQTKKVKFSNMGGGGGGSAHVIEDEGTPLDQRSNLNFIGRGVTASDNVGDDSSDVEIPDEIHIMTSSSTFGEVDDTSATDCINGTSHRILYQSSTGRVAQSAGLTFSPNSSGFSSVFYTSGSAECNILKAQGYVQIRDGDLSNYLAIKVGSDLTADRTLQVYTGDASIDFLFTDPVGSSVDAAGSAALSMAGGNNATLGTATDGWKGLYMAFSIASTTGNKTVDDKSAGIIKIATGNASVVLTCNRVTTSTLVFACLQTSDATAKSVVPVVAAGTVTFTLNAACTGNVSIAYFFINTG